MDEAQTRESLPDDGRTAAELQHVQDANHDVAGAIKAEAQAERQPEDEKGALEHSGTGRGEQSGKGNSFDVAERIEILFVVQGHREPKAEPVHPRITVTEFAEIVARSNGTEERVEIFLEDAEDPLAGDLILIEQMSVEFAPLHVARHRAKIAVKVEYNRREIERHFRPNATIGRITRWAIGDDGFGLEGDPSDYQLKHDGEVLPPDTHLGQVPHPHDRVKLDLVFKVKPQGDDGFV